MATDQSAGWVVPNPKIPRTIGILNIVFASLLLLYGMVQGVMSIASPLLTRGVLSRVQEQKNQLRAQAQNELADLVRQESATEDAAEKARIQSRRTVVQSQLQRLGTEPDLSAIQNMTTDPRVLGHAIANIVTGLTLNALMLSSGLGLIKLREWGRKLGLWVAGLKLARLAALTASQVLLVLPVTTQRMNEMMVQGNLGASGGPDVEQMMKMTALVSTAVAALTLILGSIYPVIVLWALSRPATRAACLARPESESEADLS